MRRRLFLIENALAGTRRASFTARVVALIEQGGGGSVERCSGRDAEEVGRLAAAAARSGGYDALIAAGGDGTIRHAAQAVAGTGTPLGIIPLGTANVLAHEIGIARRAAEVARVLQLGPVMSLLPPQANGEIFLLMAGAGFDGHVIAALSHAVKGRVGKLAYAGPVMQALLRSPDVLDVRIDGDVHRASWVVIANARHYGGRFVIAPTTSVRERGLQAVLFDAKSRVERAASLLALATGRLAASRHARIVACDRVEVRSERMVPVQVDGDAFGVTPLVVEAEAGARLSMIVPPRAG